MKRPTINRATLSPWEAATFTKMIEDVYFSQVDLF